MSDSWQTCPTTYTSMESFWIGTRSFETNNAERTQAEFHSQLTGFESYLADHFPGNPIVPGCVQLQWLLDGVAALGLLHSKPEVRVRGLKFLAPVRPASALQLIFSILLPQTNNGEQVMNVQVFSNTTLCTKGKLAFNSIRNGL